MPPILNIFLNFFRARQQRKRLLRRKESSCSFHPQPQTSSKSLPSSPGCSNDQKRSVSDLLTRPGCSQQTTIDQAEQPLFDTQINRELMFLDGLILDPKRLFGRRHSILSVR